MSKNPKRPRDANQLAKSIVDIATGEIEDRPVNDGKNPAAVALGCLGGAKGGKARAKALPPNNAATLQKRQPNRVGEKTNSFAHHTPNNMDCLPYPAL